MAPAEGVALGCSPPSTTAVRITAELAATTAAAIA
jgi:hypothetical protein